MRSKIIFIGLIIFVLVASVCIAGSPYRVDEDMELGKNDIYNATNINSTFLWQNGHLVLDTTSSINSSKVNQSELNVNSSTYWDEENSQSNLNVNSSNYWDTLNTPDDIALNDLNSAIDASKTFILGGNTIGWRFTNPIGGIDYLWSGAATGHLFKLNQSGNSVPPGTKTHMMHIEMDDTDVLGLHIHHNSGATAILVDNGLINFTDEEVYAGNYYQSDNPVLDSSDENNLNVNSSNYWDDYDSPAGFSWSGDLSGTGLSPEIVDDSHNHTDDTIENMTWSKLFGYPSPCPGSGATQTYLTQLNDSLTCTGISGFLLDTGDTASGNYTFDTNTLFIDSTNHKLGIGTSEHLNTGLSVDAKVSIYVDQDSRAGIVLQNNNSGPDAEFRFVATNDVEDYLAFTMPGSGNTATNSYFGQDKADTASLFLNAPTDTDKIFSLGTINAGDIILGTDNTERMRIDSSGNVGIGTMGPSATFEVQGSNSATIARFISTEGGSGGGAGITGFSDDGAAIANNDRLGLVLFGGAKDASHSLANTAGILSYSTENWDATHTGSRISFEGTTTGTTGRSEWMTLKDGKVGIGTSTPSKPITVIGDSNLTGTVYAGAANIAGAVTGGSFITPDSDSAFLRLKASDGSYSELNNDAGGDLRIITGTGGYTSMYLEGSNGYVGIGAATSPDEKLTLRMTNAETNGAYGNGLGLRDGVTTAYFKIKNQSGLESSAILGTYSAHPVRIQTNNADRVLVEADGDVGIQTTSVTGDLDVKDVVSIGADLTSGDKLVLSGESGGSNSFIFVQGAGTLYQNWYGGTGGIVFGNGAQARMGFWNASDSSLHIGSGSAQMNLTLTDTSGVNWNCGVDTTGTFSCS